MTSIRLAPPCPCCTRGHLGWTWQALCDDCLWYATNLSACPHVVAREARTSWKPAAA